MSKIFVIYVALMTTDLENIKVNQSVKFPNLFSCTSYVQSNKNEIYDSAKEVYKVEQIIEMGCVEMNSRKFTPIHKFDLTT
tara:strand:+ start:252 stop:494 length:243 start_codon:yes stop_codon:yes gene_type:complete